MRNVGILTRMNFKILMRNKGIWFFLMIIPIVSLLLLNLKKDTTTEIESATKNEVIDIADKEETIVYLTTGPKYTVKVYDSSQSKLTKAILQELADTGLISVFRADTSGKEQSEITESIDKSSYYDRIGSVLYFEENFEQNLIKGEPLSSLQIFHVKTDDRTELFEDAFNSILSETVNACVRENGDARQAVELLVEKNDSTMKKNIIFLQKSEQLDLTEMQQEKKKNIGYALSIISFGFLFCGIFIAHTIMEERQNNVLRRILLSRAGNWQYILSKLLIALVITMIQTLILAVGIPLLLKADMGIPYISYLYLMFLLGLIFNTMGMCVGILFDNVMDASYGVVFVWFISTMFSGVFFAFSMESSSGILPKISYLMPQKWILRAAEMVMCKDNTAYGMILVIAAAYLLLSLSIGTMGLKIRHEN